MPGSEAANSNAVSRRDSVDQALERRAAVLERRFDGLLADVHLPFLEVRLYRKYYLSTLSEQRLNDLETVLGAMQQHRAHTLAVLKLIHEREGVVKDIRERADEFAQRKAATLDVQTRVLQLLHAHQEVTMRLVEAIQSWRSGLTRPYPFHWQGVNYLRKVLSDCEAIDACDLRTVLPLRLSLYPLCSNITSLALFAEGDPGPNPAKIPHSSQSRSKSNRSATPAEKELRARIVDAEKAIFEETTLQAKVMRDLDAISAAGYFVPLLNLPTIIPSCASGIRISNRAWTKQLSDAINDVAHDDVDDAALLRDSSDDDDEEAVEHVSSDDGAAVDTNPPPAAAAADDASSVPPTTASTSRRSSVSRGGSSGPPSRNSTPPRTPPAEPLPTTSAEAAPEAAPAASGEETAADADTSQQLAASSSTRRSRRSKRDASESRRTPSQTSPTTSSRSTTVSTPEDTPSPVTSQSRAMARADAQDAVSGHVAKPCDGAC